MLVLLVPSRRGPGTQGLEAPAVLQSWPLASHAPGGTPKARPLSVFVAASAPYRAGSLARCLAEWRMPRMPDSETDSGPAVPPGPDGPDLDLQGPGRSGAGPGAGPGASAPNLCVREIR